MLGLRQKMAVNHTTPPLFSLFLNKRMAWFPDIPPLFGGI